MRLIKPQKLGYLQRTYALAKRHYFVSSPLVFFNLLEGTVLPEQQQWAKIAQALGSEPLDLGLSKSRAEILLAGKAYPPDPECRHMSVSIQLADVRKSLRISGKRHWQKDLFGRIRPSQAEPLQALALSYAYAFGGAEYADNPLGMGAPTKGQSYQDCAVPQIEYADKPLIKFKQNVAVAGFSPLPILWPQRQQYQGNYAGDWLNKYFPAMAADTDMRLFNSAPADQQLDNFIQGDESFKLEGLHPTLPSIEGKLPAVRVRNFIHDNGQFTEIPLHIDTLWLFPEQLLGVLIYRGQLNIQEVDGEQLSDSMLAYERMTDAANSQAHYQQIYALKTDPQTAPAHMLNESLLSPARTRQELHLREQQLAQQQQERRQALSKNSAALLKDSALPPTDITAAELTPFDNILQQDIDKGDFDLSGVVSHCKQLFDAAQLTLQQELLKAQQAEASIPASRFATTDNAQIETALARAFKSPALEQLKHTQHGLSEQQLIELGRLQQRARLMLPDAGQQPALPLKASLALRQLVIERLMQGLGLADMDLSGADLSGLIFEQVDLSHSNLANTQLGGCHFSGCNFNGAALAGSHNDDCHFNHCSFIQCNLSAMEGVNVHFNTCIFNQNQWFRLNLPGAIWRACEFSQVFFNNCQLRSNQMFNCDLQQCTYISCQLSDGDFVQCNINMSSFIETNCDFCRFNAAHIGQCIWQNCQANLLQFNQSQINKLLFSTGNKLKGLLLYRSHISESSLRGADARAINAEQASLKSCDLSLGQFSRGNFRHCNLYRSVCAGADFSGADFSHANLYRAKLRKASFIACEFEQTNLLDADCLWADFSLSDLGRCINLSKIMPTGERDEQTQLA